MWEEITGWAPKFVGMLEEGKKAIKCRFIILIISRAWCNLCVLSRCDQLDSALNEASAHIKALENKNNQLEKQVVSICS